MFCHCFKCLIPIFQDTAKIIGLFGVRDGVNEIAKLVKQRWRLSNQFGIGAELIGTAAAINQTN